MIGRSLAELIHFHHARRIGMRLRIELTVAVFEKGLRRKDKGGTIVKKQEVVGEEEGASVGKVVSLISDDTNRVLRMVSFVRAFLRVLFILRRYSISNQGL